MGEIETLRRERDKLKAQTEVRQSFKERDKERATLKAEVRALKHKKLYAVGSAVKKGSKGFAKFSLLATNLALKSIEKRSAKKMQRGSGKKKKRKTNSGRTGMSIADFI